MIAALNGSYFEYKNKKGNSTLKMRSKSRAGQNHNKILERDWLSLARFEH